MIQLEYSPPKVVRVRRSHWSTVHLRWSERGGPVGEESTTGGQNEAGGPARVQTASGGQNGEALLEHSPPQVVRVRRSILVVQLEYRPHQVVHSEGVQLEYNPTKMVRPESTAITRWSE